MPYQFLEHTADIRMGVWANNLKDLFTEAFYGLMSYITPSKPYDRGRVKRLIYLSSSDLTNLLVDFLNEILTSSQIHKEIYDEIKFNYFPDENSQNFFIEAEILGKEVDRFNKDIKAITYYEANLVKTPDGRWSVFLTFDI